MSETSQEAKKSSGGRRWLWAGGGLLAGVTVLAAVAAIAAPRAMAFHGFGGRGFGPQGFGAHFGGHGAGRHAFAARMLEDPAAAKEHVATMSELVLRSVSATDEQKQKTKQITDRLVDQLVPLVEKHHALHKALVAELSKPEIDRVAIEKLRQDGMGLADQASKIAIAGVEDIGDVLTPDQRKELIDLGRRLHGDPDKS